MFGGSRVLKLVPEVVINMGGNKKLVIGSIHETQENGPTPNINTQKLIFQMFKRNISVFLQNFT